MVRIRTSAVLTSREIPHVNKKKRKMAGRSNNWESQKMDKLLNLWSEKSIQAIFDDNKKNTRAYQVIADKLKTGRTVQQVQTKLKKIRQLYTRAKDALNRSGATLDQAVAICPHYEFLDRFLGTRPLSRPHHLVRSSELQAPEETLEDEDDEGRERETQDEELADASEDEHQSSQEDNMDDTQRKYEHDEGDIETPRVQQNRRHLEVPGSEERRKRRNGEDKMVEVLRKLNEEDRRHAKSLQDDLWDKFQRLEEDRRKEENEWMERRLNEDKKMSQDYLSMMKDMMGILTRMVPMSPSTQPTHPVLPPPQQFLVPTPEHFYQHASTSQTPRHLNQFLPKPHPTRLPTLLNNTFPQPSTNFHQHNRAFTPHSHQQTGDMHLNNSQQ